MMTDHKTGTREEWLAARLELLEAEKELTRRSDELARRRQPGSPKPARTPIRLNLTIVPAFENRTPEICSVSDYAKKFVATTLPPTTWSGPGTKHSTSWLSPSTVVTIRSCVYRKPHPS